MRNGITVTLSGPGLAETMRALLTRLIELGARTERMDSEITARLGEGAGFACRLLARNGVIVVADAAAVTPEGDRLDVEIDPNDTPDFAAEKILDQLAEEGLIDLELNDYDPQEEEQVRKRLADLGYIE